MTLQDLPINEKAPPHIPLAAGEGLEAWENCGPGL
jgi:hypothetical protein